MHNPKLQSSPPRGTETPADERRPRADVVRHYAERTAIGNRINFTLMGRGHLLKFPDEEGTVHPTILALKGVKEPGADDLEVRRLFRQNINLRLQLS